MATFIQILVMSRGSQAIMKALFAKSGTSINDKNKGTLKVSS